MNSTAIPRIIFFYRIRTVSQKDEKAHTAGLNDTAIPYFKIKITEIPLEKKKQQQQQKTKNKNKKKQVDTVILPYSCC